VAIADLLKKEGVIEGFETEGKEVKKNLVITLSAKPITGAFRISKPSRRVYAKADELATLSRRHGLLVISTPKGVRSGATAQKEKLGGEVLFRLW
jgi:small subunit ribosomal protein S8